VKALDAHCGMSFVEKYRIGKATSAWSGIKVWTDNYTARRGDVMTNRTWVGGRNNNDTNPNDWSPNGVPVPGDTLSMLGGTMNVRDNNLAGDTLRAWL
jgi:hypothetical protein